MFQLLFLALLPFVLCQETYIKPEMPVSRYEDMEPLAQNFFKVQELTRTTVYGLWQYRLYQEGDNTYITTSHYDDKETHTGSFPVLKWNEDDEVFENNDVDAFPQVDGTTRIKGTTGTGFNTYATDFLSLTYPFQTKDGNWWAYDTVGLVEDNRVRYRGEVSWTGEAYMRLWDTDSESWGSNDSSTGTDTWRVEGSGWRHQYFVGSDDREYVFTYNYGNDTRVPAWAQGVYQCTLLEYGAGSDGAGSSWSVVTYGSGTTDDAFPACPQLPSNPVVFTSVNSEWMYLATSQGSPSCPSGVASCTVNKAVAPATWWTTSNNGRDSYRNFWNVSDRIDAFNIPACVEAKHWVYDGFDYIVALTETGVATYRLWWNTHEVEELPFLSIGQPDLRFMDFFTVGHRECILVSSSYLNTYPTTPVPGSEDSWTNIYCWDPTHDNWDFAGAIPSEGTLWATHFTHDDRQYIVRVEEGHHQTKNVHVYRIFIEDDEETDIYYDVWNPSNDHIYKRVDRNGDRIHKTLAVSITSLCVLILIFVFVLLMLYVSTSGGGGGGGSTDYRGM